MPTLPEFDLGPAATHRALTVVPVFSRAPSPPPRYRLGHEALAAGMLEVSELADRPNVARLSARNRCRDRVLLLEGDHLVGARQNRVLTSSAIVGAERRVILPVACVEQGRWHGPSMRFAATATMAPAGVRRLLKLSVTSALVDHRSRDADQSGVWGQIEAQQRRLRVSSATRALSQTYVERGADIAELAGRLPYPARATGLAIGIADSLVSLDVFDRPETCAFYWQRLVEGAALEAIGNQCQAAVGATAVHEIVDRFRSAGWAPVEPVGDGEELRARTPGAAASLLMLEGGLVHFGVATGTQVQSRVPAMRRQPDVIADHYRVDARIGVGGAKEVYRATDMRDGRVVAIARVPWADPDDFMLEVEQARRVRSKYTPEIYDAFVDDHEDGYLVMEFCEGKTLAQVADGALSVADAAPIMVELARGIAAIHEAHVLHRDVKLENVLLCPRPDGVALKIIDFGLSARARSSATDIGVPVNIGGTLPYMPLEALSGQRLDARSDVYSFAICCFRLLVGELPLLPDDDESDFEYLQRLRHRDRHDLSRLPQLPPAVVQLFGRMLDPGREHRPYMTEVVKILERELGSSAIPAAVTPVRPTLRLERVMSIDLALASPDHLLVAPCAIAPLVALSPADGTTTVRAIGEGGRAQWTRRIDAVLTAGTRADLDGDGVREIYLAGPDRVVALSASGDVRYSQPHPGPPAAEPPTLIAIADPSAPRLVVDGRVVDPKTGRDLGVLGHAYAGDGNQLVPASDLRGIAYNGRAMQAFVGDHATGAAIVMHTGVDHFHVAHLEDRAAAIEDSAVLPRRRVRLAIYGPGGERVAVRSVASDAVATGDLVELERVSRAPHFGPDAAPLAVLGRNHSAIVIVPLLSPDASITPTLIGFGLPQDNVVWRASLARRGGRALLADATGSGKPVLIVGDGHELTARDPWTGSVMGQLACTGLPIAYGDPFATGHGQLFTVSGQLIEVWRGPECPRFTMQWSGARGDLWRTGTFGLGPR